MATAAAMHLGSQNLPHSSDSSTCRWQCKARIGGWAHTLKGNVTCKDLWQEVSGSLGDIGTFLPIVIALTLVNGLDLGTTLLATGLYNILTGLLFGVPMPVQPMKAIAAAAITEGNPLTVPQIMAGGLSTAMVLFVLGCTGLIWVVHRLIPLPVVRGIQLSQGLGFAITAVNYVIKEQSFGSGKAKGDRPWLGLDGRLLAVVVFCFVVLVSGTGGGMADEGTVERKGNAQEKIYDEENSRNVSTNPHEEDAQNAAQGQTASSSSSMWVLQKLNLIPTALTVFLLGVILAFVRKPHIFKELHVGPSTPHLVKITSRDWKIGFIRAAVPQLPLSILNSVVAVCKLSKDLFPSKVQVSPVRVSVSVALMNLVGCWFGVLPVCHGAGGLAGQYRFGARNGISVVFLGAFKLLIGVLLGSSLLHILAQFPIALLGVLLFFSGVELAMACRDQNSRLDSFVMLTCVGVAQASSSLALGCGFGIGLYVLLKLREADFISWRSRLHNLMRRGSTETLTPSA
ncbi:hypothetical protein O6H91_11G045900 [Diphasiastrum complanatum]|uniref:Uncharacterized protein n=1 Tax=Diphasiastrum complanatum TaxID=34168 RepID=A0ACC2C9R7_DIPCM|nr:hypothetical protein O6H91_11G045900 [Diphasiastrum complanatum]